MGELDGLDLVGKAGASYRERGARECESSDYGSGGDIVVAALEGVADCLDAIDVDDDLRGGLLSVQEIEGDWLIEKVSRVVVNPGG